MTGFPIALDLAKKARPQIAAPAQPLPAPYSTPFFPTPTAPGAAPVAFMCLQVTEPAQRGAGMRLMRQTKWRLMATKAVVAIEQAGNAKALDARPEIGSRVASLCGANRRRPASVRTCRSLGYRKRAAGSLDGVMHRRRNRKRHRHPQKGDPILAYLKCESITLKRVRVIYPQGPAPPSSRHPRLYLPTTSKAFCHSRRGRLKVLSGFHCFTVQEVELKRTRRLMSA